MTDSLRNCFDAINPVLLARMARSPPARRSRVTRSALDRRPARPTLKRQAGRKPFSAGAQPAKRRTTVGTARAAGRLGVCCERVLGVPEDCA